MSKKLLSIVLCMVMLVLPFSGSFAFTASAAVQPVVTFTLDNYATITPQTTVSVTYLPSSGTTLSSCNTRLEGTSLGTGTTVSFTPASRSLPDGMYTLICEATDNLGNSVCVPRTFYVSSSADLPYTVSNGKVTADSTVTMYTADALDFTARYGTTSDGTLDPSTAIAYDAASLYNMQYSKGAVSASSVAGLPYQTFDINLAGKTSGKVAVSYSGSTLEGERVAVKVYNPSTKAWDTVGGFMGTGSVSELVDIATYKTNGVIRVAAVLDYAMNGSNMMIWSTDPQHYTKFADLNEYYYKIYQYAAKKYTAGEAAYIFTTGDLVDDRPTAAVAPAQWKVADKAMSYVEAVDMPNGLVSGNHDVADFKEPDYSAGPNTTSNYSMFAKTFPASRYNQNNWY
ncbi:MAG: hypothetical protein IJC52_02660, partial [Clostridia bacterium]|nr:hypothetical protein [Clostridia bacterium]